jgi:hypothetical protein
MTVALYKYCSRNCSGFAPASRNARKLIAAFRFAKRFPLSSTISGA